MKLNWFSPLPPAKTGIADYTLRLLPALCRHADVVLWTDRPSWSSEIEQYGEVRYYQLNNLPWSDIHQADLNIYHIGNNCDFHSSIWQVSRQCPGCAILHDVKLHHLFGGMYLQQWRDKDAYLDRMTRYYGSQGRQAAEKFYQGALTIDFMAEYYPLTFLGLENAIGVITHTQDAYKTLKQQNRWVVGHVPLAYINRAELLHLNQKSSAPPYKLVISGYLSPNRRLDKFLEALSTLDEKTSFHLDIYGQIWDTAYIQKRIQALELSKLVTLHGFIEESQLDTALANSDLAINLRYPTMGEASLSQLRIWSHALPSLVTRVGWYAELPENTVSFVRPDYEIEDIHQHLRDFLKNPDRFFEMGKNGRRLLEESHHPSVYAKAIVNFAELVQKFRHRSVAYQLVERVGEEISSWIKDEALMPAINRVAEAIYSTSL
jgi:glycosyltransferase involved in cell wall biosynthesis